MTLRPTLNGSTVGSIPTHYLQPKWKPWQKDVFKIIEAKHTDKIHIIYDAFADTRVSGRTYLALCMEVYGESGTIHFHTNKQIMKMISQTDKKNIYFIDLPHCRKEEVVNILPSIESISIGICCKDNLPIYFDKPQVFVLTKYDVRNNISLSRDKYDFYDITKDNHLVKIDTTALIAMGSTHEIVENNYLVKIDTATTTLIPTESTFEIITKRINT